MPEKILVVDDDLDSLKLIGLMLQKNGYEVIAANNGTRALQKANAEIPNLIILDVMMPDMNGYEVCRRLRANPETQGIPIIMFTAKTLIDDKVEGFEAGADDYLTKPTHPAELASRVKAILARSTTKKPKQASKGTVIGVLGAKGGVGTTTIAVNVASALMQAGEDPVVADLRPGAGSLGLFMGITRVTGLANVLRHPIPEINNELVESEVIQHTSGLRALLSSTNPKEALMNIPPEAAQAIVNALRQVGRPAILDLGSGLSPLINSIQAEMDRIIIVVEPNNVSLVMARELINGLGIEGSGRVNIVVVNRAHSSLQTPWHEVEQMLGQDIKAIVSAAPELAFQAMEAGMPMVLFQPNAIVSSQIVKMAEDLKPRIRSIAGGGGQTT